jgi:MFS family permease
MTRRITEFRWSSAPLHKRLAPLYIATVFLGSGAWYPFEKLMMRNVGFDDGAIGDAVAACAIAMLLTETLFGILADRWGRKEVLMVSSVLLAASGFVSGASHSIPVYIIGMICWALFFAASSGTFEASISAVVREELNIPADEASPEYDNYLATQRIFSSVALASASLAGGVIAAVLSIRWTYYLSGGAAFLALVPLAVFKDSKLHKQQKKVRLTKHIAKTFSSVLCVPSLRFVVIALVGLGAAIRMINGFSPLWLIALVAPVFLYGPANALLMITQAGGGKLVKFMNRVGLDEQRAKLIALGLLLLSSVGLALWKDLAVVVLCTTVLATLLYALEIEFTHIVEGQVAPEVLAGANSVISTLTRATFIPLSLLFGYISGKASVFTAAWVLVSVVLVIGTATLQTFRRKTAIEEVATRLAEQRATA